MRTFLRTFQLLNDKIESKGETLGTNGAFFLKQSLVCFAFFLTRCDGLDAESRQLPFDDMFLPKIEGSSSSLNWRQRTK